MTNTVEDIADRPTAEDIARARDHEDKLRDLELQVLADHYVHTVGGRAHRERLIDASLHARANHWSVPDADKLFGVIRKQSYTRSPVQPVLEAALLLGCGVAGESLAADREYGADIVEQAYPLRGRGLRGILALALDRDGIDAPHGGNEFYSSLVEWQHGVVRAAGFSTINIPGLIGNVANRILLDSFTNTASSYEQVAEQADFGNFHTHSIYRLGESGDFQKVPPTGEIKHGSLGEESYENKLETYGQMLTLSRQAVVDDDLQAFASLPKGLARKAKNAVERALYGLLLEASDSFYTAGQGNRLTSNPLSIAGLAAAEAALALQTGVDGDPIYATPKVLLVPPALKSLADSIYTSTSVNSTTTTDAGRADGNPFKGRFTPVSSPYLAIPSLAGSSATTWYLLADPAQVPSFQVAFLDGRRVPMVETSDAEFNTLGLAMRCIFDFGVGRMDHRAAIKSTA